MNKARTLVSLALIMSILVGSINILNHSIKGEGNDSSHYDFQISQTSEYPPFERPVTNASTLDSGSIFVNGQEIFWRYFTPNNSIIQPKNFRFSFELWWASPDPDITIMVDLSENEGESNSTSYYETSLPYEKILEMPSGEFIHYAVWMNSTYFFMNETWASFGSEAIDEESLNLTVGIQHFTYFTIFEYTILRDTVGPTLEIIHPNYDEIENKLTLDWSNLSFEIVVTDLNDISKVTLIVTFLNLTTMEIDEMVAWFNDDLGDGPQGSRYVPSLINEKFTGGDGIVEIDISSPLSSFFSIVDILGYETIKHLDIAINMPNSTPTTSATTIDWDTMLPILGSLSVVGIIAFVLIRKRG
ncbi:MAG: hypothetical protein ACFFFK_03500 [Candidatus Thorarchaeota archaeon]